MNAFRLRLMSQALPLLLAAPAVIAIPAIAYAQQPPTAAEAQAALNPPPPPTYSRAQLDQMLAPIALYPDQVLMQVLMAATFPQQVIDADEWLQDPNNAQIHGDPLVAALQPLPWDPSVKSLVAFPQIIAMMNAHMDWTQALGVAFADQQVAVMAEVQTLRNRAAAAGQFHSNSRIRYVRSGGVWMIEPVDPDEIYLPVYNPAVVYGQWEYPDYPPVYVPPPPDFVSAGYSPGPGIAFSVGFGVVAPLWGWGHPDWRRHQFVVNQSRYTHITATSHFSDNHVAIRGGAWHRTAPVATVAAPPTPRRAAPASAPRPEGTVAPAAVRAPPPRSSAPAGAPPGAGERRPTPAQGAPANQVQPAPGTPPRPAEPPHPTPGVAPPHPGEPPHPTPGAALPHPAEPPHPQPGTAPPHPGEAPRPTPEAAHPGEAPRPAEAARPPAPPPHPPAPSPQPAELPRSAPAAAPHPAPPPPAPHPAPPPPAAAPHPAPPPPAPHPAPPPPAAAPHPAPPPPAPHPAPPPPAAAPHPAPPPPAPHPAPPPPAAAPHPAPPPPAPHPAPPPPAAHPAPQPAHPAPAPSSGKPEDQPK